MLNCFSYKPLKEEVISVIINIAIFIWEKLNAILSDRYKIVVTLFETPRNFVVYDGN